MLYRAPAKPSKITIVNTATKNSLILPVLAMVVIVAASNVLVQYPINDWLTWGALSYPVAFLITDLTNRRYGAARARRVVAIGFAIAVLASIYLATPRIAIASGAAFLTAQLLDVTIFDRMRRMSWWKAPIVSSGVGSVVDTGIFFCAAFAGTGLPWMTWAAGDLGIKFVVAMAMLIPFRAAIALQQTAAQE
ncbi:MAG: uncharacterized PurR-regulated membrane protein YhhQ (DUF165 family) [Parasphingorhabdus sp.]|jgi:uncharacterized PurR-regulated membrane protein YhhQ (DUF165 family)